MGEPHPTSLTISDAARIRAVNRRTIRRHLARGHFANAFMAGDGAWHIPTGDLVVVGRRRLEEDWRAGERAHGSQDRHDGPEGQAVHRLRTEVAVLRARVAALEVIAKEREERIADLRLIMRMLPSPPSSSLMHALTAPATPAAHVEAGNGRAAGPAGAQPAAAAAGGDDPIWEKAGDRRDLPSPGTDLRPAAGAVLHPEDEVAGILAEGGRSGRHRPRRRWRTWRRR